MKILGIETSCDETAAAVVEDGKRLLSNVVASQIDIHAQYGGVVPEVAARSHIEVINPVINQALTEADLTWDDIDAIAVTYAPGLAGSLLVGTLAARTLALVKNKPLYPVHHVEAHVYANFLVEDRGIAKEQPLDFTSEKAERVTPGGAAPENVLFPQDEQKFSGADQAAGPAGEKALIELALPKNQPQFPLLALIVSGGHTQLVLFRDHGDYELIGQTRDDAVGEAFDKVAKIIGLPYPGGPSISKAALAGDPSKYKLPIARLDDPYSFSFSGLKTAVLRAVQAETGVDITFPSHGLKQLLNDLQRNDFAASFQKTAIKTLVEATLRAYEAYQPKSVVIAGGVATNQLLREELANSLPIKIEYAPMALCTDNAAMIATLGYYQAQKVEPIDPRSLEVKPSLSMSETTWK